MGSVTIATAMPSQPLVLTVWIATGHGQGC
jgi:hypothetical protein